LLLGTAPLAVFLVAALALNISPGPDMLYVISRSLEQGRKAGIVSALGIGTGTLVHTLVTAVGLSAILLSIPVAYMLIRYAGAAYLLFLGLRMLFAKRSIKPRLGSTASSDHSSLGNVFRQGVATNVLNPKVALFFLAFLPQFVDQSKGAAAVQMVLLGLMFDTSGTTVNMIVGTFAGHVSETLRKRSGFSRFQTLLPAAILIALAVLVAFR
jgi:threonine/homoserine/homoserine lactone efflux protein